MISSLAEKYGKNSGQIILRFEIQEGFIVLPKSTNPGRIAGNLEVFDFVLTEEELKAMAKQNVHFLGAINNKELSGYYQKMDVFVLPSLIEPWGLVVEEALNNGLPVIVSDRVGCAEEIIDESNGIVF